MEWSTHMLSGVVAGYYITGGDYRGAIVGGIAGVIPDLDEPKSRFGKVFFPISYPLNALVGHRTLTHSLLFLGIVSIIASLTMDQWFVLSIASGLIAHILGDMLTGKVKLFYPFKKGVGFKIDFIYFKLIDRITRLSLCVFLIIIGMNELKKII